MIHSFLTSKHCIFHSSWSSELKKKNRIFLLCFEIIHVIMENLSTYELQENSTNEEIFQYYVFADGDRQILPAV